jgi:hypothetical protein
MPRALNKDHCMRFQPGVVGDQAENLFNVLRRNLIGRIHPHQIIGCAVLGQVALNILGHYARNKAQRETITPDEL